VRSTEISALLVVAVATVSGCRPFRGASAGAVAAATGESVPPSGLGTRAVIELPNGLQIALEENHAAPVVAISAWVHVGAADDPAGQEGLAHLFQHLLFLSTRTRPAGRVARDVAEIGGRMGAFTTYDETVFQAVVAAPFVDNGIGLLADILTQPSLSPADLDSARRSAADDLRQAAGAADRIAAEQVLATAFAGDLYGRPLLGTETSLAALSDQQARRFFEKFYVASNTTLVMVGDFDASRVRERLAAAFGAWPAGARAPARPAPRQPAGPLVGVSTAEVAGPQLVIGFRIPGVKDHDAPALQLLAAILGSDRGGRLDMEIVRNRQLGSAPRAHLFAGRQAGLLIATTALGPGRVDEAARAVRDEILRLGREPVGADELDRARTIVEGDLAFAQAGLGGYARRLGQSIALGGDASFESDYLESLRRVDPETLMRVAARTFQSTNVIVTVVLPVSRDPPRDDRAAKLIPRLRAVAAGAEEATGHLAPNVEGGASPSGPGSGSAALGGSGRDGVEYLLPSGVRLLVLRDDTAPQLSVRAVWPGGLRTEDARLAGATSLLARLLPRATKTRGPEALTEDLAEVGGRLDGVAGVDSLALRGDFLGSHWERGLELLVDCVRNPRLLDDEIERERRVQLDAIRARDDDPTLLALRLFESTLYGRHPYAQDLLGTADTVAGLTRRRLINHYRRSYRPRDLTLAVLGAVEPERVAAKVQSLFADAPRLTGAADEASEAGETGAVGAVGAASGREPPRVVVSVGARPPDRSEATEVFQLISKAQARVVIGYPGVTIRDPDRFALEVLAGALGGPDGQIVKALTEASGLAGVGEAVSHQAVDPGYFAIYAAARPDAVEALVVALRAHLRHVAEVGIPDPEVARARRILIGTRALALERRGAVAMALALRRALAASGTPGTRAAPGETGRSYRSDVDELGKVTAADVARVARRIIDPRREIVAVVRPRDNDRPTTSLLEAPPRYTRP